jgi:hypothetical protein
VERGAVGGPPGGEGSRGDQCYGRGGVGVCGSDYECGLSVADIGCLESDKQLEMEIPKTLWLKKHMPAERFKECMFFE